MNLLQDMWAFLAAQGVSFGLKILGAIAVWIVGRWLIDLVSNASRKMMARGGRLDLTLTKYLASIINALLTLVLALAILGIFGIQTTSFAALFAGLGLAIGVAWGGLLAHFAAGIFLQALRPFKVGDFVTAGGVTGTVTEIGLFNTAITTPDNVLTIVGNNKIFSDVIQNFSAHAFRRVDCTAKVANSVDVRDAIARLRTSVAAIPNIVAAPVPEIEILSFTPEGPVLAVRPYAHTDNYWQVYFDTNQAIVRTFAEAGYPVPETPLAYKTTAAG